jgi:pimeloyl-ACP methyl ester carboxylesterase
LAHTAVGACAPQEPLSAFSGLRFTESGRGSDVLLVHGVAGDYRQWEPIASILNHSHRVVAISRRFHWLNPPAADDGQYSYEAQSDDLSAFLKSVGRPAHVVGTPTAQASRCSPRRV